MKNSTPCKILFLDDSAQDVELMKYELDVSDFNHVSKHVSSKKEFIDALENFNPDVIIADYSLPLFNGMHAFRLFVEKNSSIPFILVTGSLSEELSMECLAEGVDDFILKSSYKRLPQVILRNLEIKKAENEKKRIAVELEISKRELEQLKEKAEKEKTHELLSKREFDIFCFIAQGKTIKEIADDLILSPATVATYRARLMEKLNLKSNVEIANYALRHKLID